MRRAESHLYFELITGIDDVIQELVITWKEPDTQTGKQVVSKRHAKCQNWQSRKLRFEVLCTKPLLNHHVYFIIYILV